MMAVPQPDAGLLALPVMPAVLADGLCTRSPRRDLWTSADHHDREAARWICRGCPVREVCAEWALSLPVNDTALWGGMSARERVALRRERRAAG